jgi:hypothetical protein
MVAKDAPASITVEQYLILNRRLFSESGADGIHPYWARFWQAYLGQAYSLWVLVRSAGPGLDGWSRVQVYDFEELADRLKANPVELLGGRIDPEYKSGMLARLHQEQILAVKTLEGSRNVPDLVLLSVFYILPLLTPAQVEQLSETDQAAHQAWIEARLRRLDDDQTHP